MSDTRRERLLRTMLDWSDEVDADEDEWQYELADVVEAALVAYEESPEVVERCNRLLGKPPIEMYGWDTRDAAVLAVLRAARGVPTEGA